MYLDQAICNWTRQSENVVIAADLLHVYVGVKRRVVVNEEQEIYEGPKNVALEDVVFGGGPKDKSGLTEYVDHVGCEQWDDLNRGELKLVAYGRKLSGLPNPPTPPPPNKEIMRVMHDSGLLPLTECSYEIGDKRLLSDFAERWHRETNTFHLPI
ncbi:uncharacterized protein LOC114389753 [Glycine soja]|uniref:uncharacterized protein LOC114389753 n=1 Tax=Glycine soja TaxID=3848 RepID=UPI0010392E53|nr:uncharacterized protein LOC114389753 [Glycine soja]